MEDKATGECISPGHLRLTDGLEMTLASHDRGAIVPQSGTSCAVNGVVDASMVGDSTTEQLAVGGVGDGVDLEVGDVADNKAQPAADVGSFGKPGGVVQSLG